MDDLTRRDVVKAGVAGLSLGAVASAESAQGAQRKEQSGSEKLIDAMLGRKRVLNKDQIRDLLGIVTNEKYKLVKALINGQPDPDLVSGTVQVPPRLVGELLRELFEHNHRVDLSTFPYGIPNIDLIHVDFTLRPPATPWKE